MNELNQEIAESIRKGKRSYFEKHGTLKGNNSRVAQNLVSYILDSLADVLEKYDTDFDGEEFRERCNNNSKFRNSKFLKERREKKVEKEKIEEIGRQIREYNVQIDGILSEDDRILDFAHKYAKFVNILDKKVNALYDLMKILLQNLDVKD